MFRAQKTQQFYKTLCYFIVKYINSRREFMKNRILLTKFNKLFPTLRRRNFLPQPSLLKRVNYIKSFESCWLREIFQYPFYINIVR